MSVGHLVPVETEVHGGIEGDLESQSGDVELLISSRLLALKRGMTLRGFMSGSCQAP
jgi:hypothetical protein